MPTLNLTVDLKTLATVLTIWTDLRKLARKMLASLTKLLAI